MEVVHGNAGNSGFMPGFHATACLEEDIQRSQVRTSAPQSPNSAYTHNKGLNNLVAPPLFGK